MSHHQYIIGTGYHSRNSNRGDALAWFFRLWMDNTLKYSQPFVTYVLATGDGRVPDLERYKPEVLIWTDILGDLGHCGQLLSGEKPYHFAGGPICVLTLAMLAYMNECDFIFKEQDLLAFGDYVETMYQELGNKGCIFGSQRGQSCANSLFLVRHSFIPEFVRLYLGTARENTADQMAEKKFARLEREHPKSFCRYSFGVDRERPFNMKAAVWYAQKFTPEELMAVREAGLIQFDKLPEGVPVFTN